MPGTPVDLTALLWRSGPLNDNQVENNERNKKPVEGDWHQLSVERALSRLSSDEAAGLKHSEAAVRLSDYGRNELIDRGVKSGWRVLWQQLTSTMVLVLMVAAAAALALGDPKDAVAILAIVVLNAVLGYTQEYKAEKGMAALRKLAIPNVKVRRDSQVKEMPARELVPGDIILLEAGNLVPADCRIIRSINLRTQEASLTGESEPISKIDSAIEDSDLPIGDRRNMAYMGTVISNGRGVGAVTATGMRTEIGRIAVLIQTVTGAQTPLQKRLNQLGRILAFGSLIVVIAIFFLGLLRGEDITLMFLTAVSIGVAAVPEGLPAVVTIALAFGAQRMLKRRALMRRLPTVEALGSVTVICSDKTGTLTKNEMEVSVIRVMSDLAENGATPTDGSSFDSDRNFSDEPAATLLLAATALCNDAELVADADSWIHAIGDPTELALLRAASDRGMSKKEIETDFERVAELGFDSERKRMTTVHRFSSSSPIHGRLAENFQRDPNLRAAPYLAFTKGAADSLLEVSSSVWTDGRIQPMNETLRIQIVAANDHIASSGRRVLGVAFRPLATLPAQTDFESLEHDLVFLGLIGMSDPPRPEAKTAVSTCIRAGVRPVMITGDHPSTALSIARELGISRDQSAITGVELSKMSPEDLDRVVEHTSVYARVSPEHKLKIIEALQQRGHVVAMTGDGVNDAPALKKADIGIAMGIEGTDVAKKTADMVLLDDNFATIVAAVEEGRVIYDNIRKFIKYIMATNSAEMGIMLMALLAGMPLPLLPLQILWLNLVTDGLPALALAVEPAEHDLMKRPPHRSNESIFGDGLGLHIIWVGLLMSSISLAIGYWYFNSGDEVWRTMVFTTLTFSQMGHVMAIRSNSRSFFSLSPLSNKPLIGAVTSTVAAQLVLIYVPFFQSLFKTVALSAWDLSLCVIFSSLVFFSVEAEKWHRRWKARLEKPSFENGWLKSSSNEGMG